MLNIETWRSQIAGRQGVIRINPDGTQRTELIRGRREFSLSPTERKVTESQCASDTLNPFRNGQFVPVRLVETDEDFAALSTAQGLTDADIDELIDGNFQKAKKVLEGITSVHTLRRILDVANEKDASTKRLQLFRDRLAELGEPVVGSNAGPGQPDVTDIGTGDGVHIPGGGIPSPQKVPMSPQDPQMTAPTVPPMRG